MKKKTIFLLKKNKIAVSMLFLLLRCSCLILSTWSFLLMSWHSLVFLWNSSFHYLWPPSVLICFWLDIWRASYSQKSNAIDGWAPVPSQIFCFTSGRVLFSVPASDLYCFSHIIFDDIQVFNEKNPCNLASLNFFFINNCWFVHPNKSPLHIFPSELSCYEIGRLDTFVMSWATS